MASCMDPWRIKTSRRLLERRWLVLHEQHVVLPWGGEIDEFHLIESPDWVGVLALTAGRQAVVVEQYRHGLGGKSRELPAGIIDTGETPLDTARRELLEETGYAADDWRAVVSVATEPSRHTNRAHFFFATGARRVAEPQLDSSERIDVTLVSVAELLLDVDEGRITHGVHIGAILLCERRGWLG
jgi:8-oxo-dGTP pyrophosphatase MutT (NUDIX family)